MLDKVEMILVELGRAEDEIFVNRQVCIEYTVPKPQNVALQPPCFRLAR